MLNDYSYDPKILILITSSKIYGLLLFVFSIIYFISINCLFLGISIKTTGLLLFPTLMLTTDSLFLFLNSLSTSKDILCYYNQNINEVPPTYKIDLIHNIIGSSIRSWHYYNLLRLFVKGFFSRF
jgi:hypothetical protein